MTRTVRPALTAGILGAALALAACTGDDSSAPAAETPPESDTSAAEADQRAEEAAATLADLPTTDVDVSPDENYLTAVGAPDAEVTMVVFEDYLCHYCQAMSTQALPELQDLVDDGTLRIEYRDVGVLAPQSVTLAQAAWAAAQQDGYAAYHESLMADPPAAEDVTAETLTERAVEAGLEPEQFGTDLAAADTAAQISANAQLAMDIDLSGTPTTVVGGFVMVGLQDAETLRLAVEGVAAGVTPGGETSSESGSGPSA
ncbi:thioredoxin domain-containing protein [Georgenia sp. Z1344]|uniref:thioredoxin domain-containing protein n=1 Tax=Georgenia sp. Z1344 TaxID=3416706 RepID=UPI003CF6E4EC